MTALFEVTASDVAATNDEWYTPRWIFGAAGLTFDMDVCAPVAPEFRSCPARRYLTVLDDGLTAGWSGLVWCNPPYSKAGPWADRLILHPTWLALVIPSNALWRGRLMLAADAVTLLSVTTNKAADRPGFGRPDGSQSGLPYSVVLLARGEFCTDALARVAAADSYAKGAYHVRPGVSL